jgi:hypothetical protein
MADLSSSYTPDFHSQIELCGEVLNLPGFIPCGLNIAVILEYERTVTPI